jgi:hypothetical protein
LSLKIRYDEIPLVGDITKNAFHNDKQRFIDFSNVYDDPFEDDFETKLTQIKSIVVTSFHIGKIASITESIKVDVPKISPYLDEIGRYAKMAKSKLGVPLKLFGVKEVRKKIHDMEIEGLDGALHSLILNIESNFSVLEAKGYKQVKLDELKALKLKIYSENTDQEGLKYDKEQAVESNKGLFEGVLAVIADIQETGKILFKRESPAKALEYTMQDILRKIRQDELHTLISGTVKLASGELVSNVKVSARPSLKGKRGKSTTTDKKGYYEIRGLVPKSYIIMFTLPDGRIFEVSADAKTNEKVVVDFTVPE